MAATPEEIVECIMMQHSWEEVKALFPGTTDDNIREALREAVDGASVRIEEEPPQSFEGEVQKLLAATEGQPEERELTLLVSGETVGTFSRGRLKSALEGGNLLKERPDPLAQEVTLAPVFEHLAAVRRYLLQQAGCSRDAAAKIRELKRETHPDFQVVTSLLCNLLRELGFSEVAEAVSSLQQESPSFDDELFDC